MTSARRIAGAALASALAGGMLAVGGAAVASASVRPSAQSGLDNVMAAPRLGVLNARPLGMVAASREISGALALKPRSQAAVRQFIGEVSNPRSPMFHHYLAAGQYASRFGPTAATIAAVRHQLSADGLQVTGVSSNGLLVSFRASAARTEAAFHTGLERVALATGGVGQATTAAVRLPASIAGSVQAVIGLDDLVHESNTLMRAHLTSHHSVAHAKAVPKSLGGPVASCPGALSVQQTGGLTDQQVANSYGLNGLYNSGDVGTGQTVDIYELEPFEQSDINTFYSCYFPGGSPHDSVTTVDGGPGTGPGSAEAALDVEDVSAIAPNAQVHVFEGPNMNDNFGPLDTWNQIAIADDAHQISTSWGVCETALQVGAPGIQQAENDIFEQIASQGQSVFSSAGDDGSDDCAGHAAFPVAANLSVDDPSSQPYVVSVGGTTILNPTDPPSETVWNNGTDGGGAGGGISETWAMPPWQVGFTTTDEANNQACSNDPTGVADNFHVAGDPTTLASGTSCRELPDVTALADPQSGISIVYAGSWFQIGGTSSSTPLWAAMTAEMNASSTCGSANLGFISPELYQVAGGPNYSSAFNDITLGNNDNLDVGNGTNWSAGTGYDLASGLGSPEVTNSNGMGLAAQLCGLVNTSGAASAPVVTSLTSTSGPLAGGGTTTINGSNFGSTEGSVYFGDVAATVTNWTSSAVTVDVPAAYTPPGTPAGTAVGADVIVSTAGSPSASSSPNADSVFHYTAGTSSSGTPVIDYISSPNGPSAGGNTVEIVGSNLLNATAVTFGDVAATINSSATSNGQQELQVTVPASDETCANPASQGLCQVNVTVTNANGSSTPDTILPAYQGPIVYQPSGAFIPPAGCGCEVAPAPSEYDYAPTPTITSITPLAANETTAYAAEEGGSLLTINGTGFNILDLYWVNFGQAGINFSEDFGIDSISPTSIEVTAFADPNISQLTTEPDPGELSVQTGGGLASVSAASGMFAYAGVPEVLGLSQHDGSQSNPPTITVSGAGLSDADEVVLVGQGALGFVFSSTTTFTVNSDSSLTVPLPTMFAIPTDLLVCSASGCSNADPSLDGYTPAYVGQPVLQSSTPKSGGEKGGTIVILNGQLDENVVSVHFGTVPATVLSESVFSPSGPLVVMAPPVTKAETVNITITTLGGELAGHPTSADTSAATFKYVPSGPSAPQDLVVKAGAKSATASWKAPKVNGGAPITEYAVTATSKGQKTVSLRTDKLTATIGGLTAGKKYTISVRGVNKYGGGTAATAVVTPRA